MDSPLQTKAISIKSLASRAVTNLGILVFPNLIDWDLQLGSQSLKFQICWLGSWDGMTKIILSKILKKLTYSKCIKLECIWVWQYLGPTLKLTLIWCILYFANCLKGKWANPEVDPYTEYLVLVCICIQTWFSRECFWLNSCQNINDNQDMSGAHNCGKSYPMKDREQQVLANWRWYVITVAVDTLPLNSGAYKPSFFVQRHPLRNGWRR